MRASKYILQHLPLPTVLGYLELEGSVELPICCQKGHQEHQRRRRVGGNERICRLQ